MAPPPPPSQAGRFKPRKPAKKIQAPGTTGGGEGAAGGEQGGSNNNNNNVNTGGRGGGGGRGYQQQRGGRGGRDGGFGRGGGRDGRGGGRGGGRGRFNLPQGQVFFTASQSGGPPGTGGAAAAGGGRNPTSQAERRRMVASSSSTTIKNRRDAAEASANEEIVGTLEEGIGASLVPSSVLSGGNSDYTTKFDSALNAFERALLGEEYDGGTMGKTTFVSAGADLYDSDTSDEGIGRKGVGGLSGNNRQGKEKYKKPVSLPFPDFRGPIGIGESETTIIPTPIAPKSSSNINDKLREDENKKLPTHQQPPSPFVSALDKDAMRFEKNNFFLVQLPTRLPPLTMGEIIGDEGRNTAQSTGEDLATVATPALQTATFDNALSKAIPGRLGKIKVYKSGRTVLELQGPDGQPAVEMKVSEGLTCSFKQHAVAIDLDSGNFLPLGNVGKTIVITPDLNHSSQFA